MHVGTEGTAPGVEQGKEMSLLVKEQSSPKSHEVWADTDGLQPVTYIYPGVHLMLYFPPRLTNHHGRRILEHSAFPNM